MNCVSVSVSVSVSAPVAVNVKQNNKTRNGCVGTAHITTSYVHTSSLYLSGCISISKQSVLPNVPDVKSAGLLLLLTLTA